MSAIRVVKLSIALLLTACGRDISFLERRETVERLTGGDLCQTAQINLINKQDLLQHLEMDDLRYKIIAPGACLDTMSSSIFDDNILKNCNIGSKFSCSKDFNGNTISLFRTSKNSIEINIWS